MYMNKGPMGDCVRHEQLIARCRKGNRASAEHPPLICSAGRIRSPESCAVIVSLRHARRHSLPKNVQ